MVRGEDERRESYEIWLAPKDVLKTWQALLDAGATPVGSQALERLRIADGIPLYGVDIRERDLPQETEQARALNFSKGCYVGQEIVERIRSRGNVHRKFTGFLIEGAGNVAAGDKIIYEEKEVGEITSVGVLPTLPASELRPWATFDARWECRAARLQLVSESDGDSTAVRWSSSSGTHAGAGVATVVRESFYRGRCSGSAEGILEKRHFDLNQFDLND